MKTFARISRSGLAFALAACLTVTGCSTAWIQTALQDLPVLVQIATNILSIVSVAQGNGTLDATTTTQINTIATQVKTDLQLVQTLVTQYQSAAASAQPGIASQIDNALSTISTNLTAILNAAHIANQQLQATITGAVTLALATVLAIQSLVPAPTTVTATRRARVPMKPADAATLKRQWNVLVSANGFSQFAIQ